MYLLTVLFTLLLAPGYAFARHDDDNRYPLGTITSSASLTCATGNAQSKYESCSLYISSKLDECDATDQGCACALATSGFECMTSYCPTHTLAVCEGALALQNLCGLNARSPTLTGVICPSGLPYDRVVSASPTSSSLETSSIQFFTLSDTNSPLPTYFANFNASSGSGGMENATSITVPSMTGAASARSVVRDESELRVMLGMGIMISVAVGGLAAGL